VSVERTARVNPKDNHWAVLRGERQYVTFCRHWRFKRLLSMVQMWLAPLPNKRLFEMSLFRVAFRLRDALPTAPLDKSVIGVLAALRRNCKMSVVLVPH
jgi:hypothetical protein